MSDFEKSVKEFEQNAGNAVQAKADGFTAQVAPALPIAILFCNKDGQANADAAQIMALFEGSFADRYNTADDALDGFEFINYLAECIGEENDVVFVTNAKESGFNAIRLMQYFEQQFYITDIAQAQFLNKLGFLVEEQDYLEDYARHTRDKAWEMYDVIRDELTANGFTAAEMGKGCEAIDKIIYKEDRLHTEIVQLIDKLKHV